MVGVARAVEIVRLKRSGEPARSFLKVSKANGVIRSKSPCYKKDIRGKRKNEDILVRDN